MTDLVHDQFPKSNFIDPKDEGYIFRLHGRVVGRTMTCIRPSGDIVFIQVLPTALEGHLPEPGDLETVWAHVYFVDDEEKYICAIYGSSPRQRTQRTAHLTLKSALRKARKRVQKMAAKPNPGWQERLQLEELTSLYPEALEIIWARLDEIDNQHELEKTFKPEPDFDPAFEEAWDDGDHDSDDDFLRVSQSWN